MATDLSMISAPARPFSCVPAIAACGLSINRRAYYQHWTTNLERRANDVELDIRFHTQIAQHAGSGRDGRRFLRCNDDGWLMKMKRLTS